MSLLRGIYRASTNVKQINQHLSKRMNDVALYSSQNSNINARKLRQVNLVTEDNNEPIFGNFNLLGQKVAIILDCQRSDSFSLTSSPYFQQFLQLKNKTNDKAESLGYLKATWQEKSTNFNKDQARHLLHLRIMFLTSFTL